MTVPGKGGRPRKWRSDADRVRAHRARQRGEEEPATFEAALVDGDELAQAVERSRQLQADLVEAIASVAELDEALQAERRRHERTQRKLDRAATELVGMRSTDSERTDELRALNDELQTLRTETTSLQAQLTLAATTAREPGPNRAARRWAAKRDRRGG